MGDWQAQASPAAEQVDVVLVLEAAAAAEEEEEEEEEEEAKHNGTMQYQQYPISAA